ncbi:hypothetical protein [Roseibacillus persicicus]|uniref:Serine protease n=1 Tax=Roseibacillus persicicus TaxID=454148 RepID=A0A918WME1_9BACT|nr:hypothetical protein [Roseibacillus persicicus]GHC58472.1 hypothetical protein GCM10007100_26850 [Roseibacillus persicicus]
MKNAIFPLTIAASLSLSSCLEEDSGPSQEDYDYLQDEHDSLKEELEKVYLELDDFDAKMEEFKAVEEKAKSADEKAKELKELQKVKEETEEEMRKLREEFEAYQKKYEAKVRKAGEGEEFATLEVGGRTLSSVVISSVSETAVKVRHADGFATLDSATAPNEWKERFFLRSEQEVEERARELAAFLNPPEEVEAVEGEPEKKVSSYQQRRQEREQQEEALKSLGGKVEKAIVSINGSSAQGSGFFAQDGITTYLYTSGHLLDSNGDLKITDLSGKEWKSFGELEVAEGTNIVRLAVTDPVENLLELRPSGDGLGSKTLVAAFGLQAGANGASKDDARLRGPRDGRYDVSGALKESVGGPLVTAEEEVIGLVTQDAAPRKDIWREDARHSRVIQYVARLDVPLTWKKIPLGQFLTATESLQRFDQVTKLIAAMGALEPSPEGLNLDVRVGGGATVRTIFEDNKDLNVVMQVMKVEKDMAGSKMKISERDLNRRFRSFYETVMRGAENQALSEGDFSSYHQNEVAISLEARKAAVDSLRKAHSAVTE